MKKNLIVALALVFVLGIAGTAFAAANPFVDVPAKHWAYDAVSKLAKAGILDGYGDGTYRGERLASRYEMAQATAKAMARADKADAQMKALIDKLAVEFAAELNNLGVRVAKLEKNASTIKFTGDSRIRFQQNNDQTARWNERFRLNLAADVADNVAFQGRIVIQNQQNSVGAATSGANDQLEYDLANFTFKNVMPKINLTVGRTGQDLLNNLFYSYNYWDGAKLTYTNGKLSMTGGYGDARYNPGPNTYAGAMSGTTVADVTTRNDSAFGFAAIGATYQFNKEFTGSVAYLSTSGTNNQTAGLTLADGTTGAVHEARFATLGFGLKYQVPDWMFLAEYAKNSAGYWNDQKGAGFSRDGTSNPSTDAMVFQLNYKLADMNKPNTWQVYVQWHRVGEAMVDIAKLNGAYYQYPIGTTGFSYGVKYIVAKNVMVGVELQSLKWVSANAAGDTNIANNGGNAFQFRTDFRF